MGLGSFFKKLFGKGDQPAAPVGQTEAPGVPGAVDTVGVTPPAVPVSTTPAPAEPAPAAAPVIEKTA